MSQTNLPEIGKQWNWNDPKASEQAFRKLLADHPDAPEQYRLEVRTQVARALGLQKRFDAANKELDAVDAKLGDTPRARVRYLLERGRVLNSSGHPKEARPLFEQAFDAAKKAREDRLAVDALHMIAIVAEPAEALEINLQAIAYAEKSDQPDAKKWLGSLYNNTGWSLHELGKYDEALAIFKKGLAWQKEHGKPQQIRIARWTVGRTLRSLGRIDEALAIQQAIRHDFPDADLPYVEEELGECLYAKGQADKARAHFHKAWELLKDDPWLSKHEPERIARLQKLGADAGSGVR